MGIEKTPRKQKDAEAARQELLHGRFSITAEERTKILERAKAEGKDPDEALAEHQRRMDQATGRLRAAETKEAVESLERFMNEEFKRENKEQK